MTDVTLRDRTGAEAGVVELDPATFGIEPNEAVMHQVVVAQLAARRSGTQSTKTRAEVRGGGAKPWRQKGTALSDRAASEKVVVVKDWSFETPKTSDAVRVLEALGTEGRVLVVADRADVNTWKSFANLSYVHVISPGELNAYDVLVNDWVIFTERTLPGSTISTGGVAEEADDLDVGEGS